MAIKINTRSEKGITILELEGLFSPIEQEEYNLWETKIKKEISANLVVDFSKVSGIDSSGIGALIAAVQIFSAKDATVNLAGLNSKIHTKLTITKLDRFFNIFPDVNSAIASFAQPVSEALQVIPRVAIHGPEARVHPG